MTWSSSARDLPGLALLFMAAREGLRTVVIEPEAPGGQAGSSSRIENYLGFPSGVTGADLGPPRLCPGLALRRGVPHAVRHVACAPTNSTTL